MARELHGGGGGTIAATNIERERIMTTKRENATITTTITEQGELKLAFSNGELLYLHPENLTPEMLQYAALHGLKQKLVDAAAIPRDPTTGRSATTEQKFAAVKAVYDRLMTGEWNAARGDGNGAGGLLYRALCAMYENTKTPEQIRAFLEGKSDAEKSALRKNPKVAAIIATLRPTDDTIDTDALLDDLAD